MLVAFCYVVNYVFCDCNVLIRVTLFRVFLYADVHLHNGIPALYDLCKSDEFVTLACWL